MLSQRQIAGKRPGIRQRTKNRQIRLPNLAPLGKACIEKALYGLGRSFLNAYMQLMLDVDIQKHAPLPVEPKILAPNHPTSIDPFYILTLLSEPVSVVITAAAFDVPGFGHFLRATGHIPAVRGSGGATVDTITRQVEIGHNVAIFPEGSLTPLSGGFLKPHSGVARVAIRTGAPVIPIGIGLQRDRIRVTKICKDDVIVVGHLYMSGPYAITVGRPLYYEGDVRDREFIRSTANQIMHHIQSLANESERRVSQTSGAAPQQIARPVEAL